MVQQKLAEYGVEIDVASVISDFELSIVKALDEMIGSAVNGCFFHLTKAFQSKVAKNMKFQTFIKGGIFLRLVQCVSV